MSLAFPSPIRSRPALLLAILLSAGGVSAPAAAALDAGVIDVGSRRELFVDQLLVERLDGASLQLCHPVDAGTVLRFDRPWEGAFCAYVTVIKDGSRFRLYYRGRDTTGADDKAGQVTCYAESTDGRRWTKPHLGLFRVAGTLENNVILTEEPFTHNFSPVLDARPGVPAAQRFKALAGSKASGLVAFASADGLRWEKLRTAPVITQGNFDSQNVSFWSEAEQSYLCYFRTAVGGIRRISRTTSPDYLNWTPPVLMEYRRPEGPVPVEHLYTSQTAPYFRTPHIYVATAARFMPKRRAITDEQAAAIRVHPSYYNDISDSVLLTSRGGGFYERTFLEGFVRPGPGPHDWVSRTNYPALNVVQTAPVEMSLYVQHDYGQPTAHLRRYRLRLDGFASVHAPYAGGEMVTKPVTFTGRRLLLNFATSAAGGLRVELQDAAGRPVSGFELGEAVELIGNDLERAAMWKGGADLGTLAGRPVRLRFVLKDADLYALRFAE